MIRNWIVLAVVLLAGCTQPGDNTDADDEPGDAPGCIGRVCLADPTSHDARHALETYGFHQLTVTSGQVGRPQVHEGLLVWQVAESVDVELTAERGYAPDILAYSFEEDRILAVARSPDYLYTKPYLQDGRVVYRVEPGPLANYTGGLGYWVEIWDSATGESRRLDPNWNATAYEPYGFDGEWAILGVKGSTNESEIGFWAYHVDDGRLRFLYRPVDRGVVLENGTEEGFNAIEVTDGVAYLGRGWKHVDEEEWTVYIHALDLETESWRRVYRGTTKFGDLGVTDNVLVAAVETGVPNSAGIGWLYTDASASDFTLASAPDASAAGRTPHTQNSKWLAFKEIYDITRPNNRELVAAYSIEDRQRIVLLDTPSMNPDRITMGDDYLVITAMIQGDEWEADQTSKYERMNIYYMSVEELEER